MNIQNLKLKPQLIQITIDDKEILEAYGETITFWMYDYLDLTTYFEFFKAQSKGDTDKLLDVVKSIIRDETGKQVIATDEQIPVDIFAAAVNLITIQLGKSVTKNSTSTEAGTQQ